MAKKNKNKINWLKRRVRTKKSLGVLGKYPRLVVFRSNKNIYAQLVDDNKQITILSSSTIDNNLKMKLDKITGKIEMSKEVGHDIASKLKENKIDKLIFDRNGYRYHGRVKAVADAIRENGINF
tara:strand:+ start:102 stop:473 length:372 start_codon:yes stop_codon:yes gene_type:complete